MQQNVELGIKACVALFRKKKMFSLDYVCKQGVFLPKRSKPLNLEK